LRSSMPRRRVLIRGNHLPFSHCNKEWL
jgi:hypothetical protein